MHPPKTLLQAFLIRTMIKECVRNFLNLIEAIKKL
jgi:hypothetical protein